MKITTLLILGVLLPPPGALAAERILVPAETLIQQAWTLSGRSLVCTLSNSEIRSTPAWSESAPCPPLSPRVAGSLARAYATNTIPESATWRCEGITLVNLVEDWWVYKVSFLPGIPGQFSGPFLPFEVYVLMNGTVVAYRPGSITNSPPPNRNEGDAKPPLPGRSP